MKEFTKTLKLYFHRERSMASLSIRSSPFHVLTFYIEGPAFEKILQGYRNHNGAEVGPYFVQRKDTYLRFSYSHPGGMQENLRVSSVAWEALVNDYRQKQVQSTGDLITCEID